MLRAWQTFEDTMNGALIMSKAMKCRVFVRSWKFVNPETNRAVWVYGFGGKAPEVQK